MNAIRTALYTPVQWVQPKAMKNRYELRRDDALYATVEFPKWYKTLAHAKSADGDWTFERFGVFNLRVLIHRAGEEVPVGIYRPKWTWTEGRLALNEGREYTWKSANFWLTQYNWLGDSQQALIHYQQGKEDGGVSDWFKTQARVEITPEAARLPELSLLVLLGWYLMVLKQQDTAATVAAAS